MPTISELARTLGYSRQYMQRCVKDGCPTDTFENARLWFGAHVKHPKKQPKSTEPERSIRRNGDAEAVDLDEALDNAAIAAQEAWLLLKDAMVERKPSQISVFLNLHSKALEARVKAERMVREELERRRILIPVSEAQTDARRIIDIVVSRLSAMPQNLAYACNPSAPDHAFEILQRECTRILSDAQKAIA